MSNRTGQKGGCQCGALRFLATGEPKFIANCHCQSCRKATGAAFSTWVGFKDEQIEWRRDKPSSYSSSLGVTRGFCAACGTPLTYAGEKWPGETHLLIGVFDDPSSFIPRNEVFTKDALNWALARKEK